MSVSLLPPDEIEQAAAGFLARYNSSKTIPVPIERIVDNDLRIDIVPIPSLRSAYDVDGFITGDLSAIYVDEFVYSDRLNRYRFTVAHEVGHVVLHGDFYESAEYSTIGQWRQFLEKVSRDDYGTLENQANTFAGMILMPTDSVQEQFADQLSQIPMSLRNRLVHETIIDKIATVISPSFQVSNQAMQIRLERMRILD